MTDTEPTATTILAAEVIRLGRRMRLLHEQVDNDMGWVLDAGYDRRLADLSQVLFGIAAVLSLVGGTPNARLNSEGIAAIRRQVEAASRIEQLDWARAILDEVDSAGS